MTMEENHDSEKVFSIKYFEVSTMIKVYRCKHSNSEHNHLKSKSQLSDIRKWLNIRIFVRRLRPDHRRSLWSEDADLITT